MSRTKLDTNGVPLIVEKHPQQYNGFPFITYLQFHSSNVLAIVDNIHHKQLQCYVLDLCQPAGVNEIALVTLAEQWYKDASHLVPFSVYINQRNLDVDVNTVYRTYNIEFITRIVGPLFSYPISEVTITRRKKRKPPVTPKAKVVKLR